jgi:hypothetical protein
MGIATVAVYSEADKDALFVDLADEAVCIGPAASKESYLVADKIIAACKQTGAQAVHPGYGFLSENAEFSRRLEEEGIKFIGPKHYSIAKMGDKIESKKLAIEAKVNTIPGYNDAIAGPDEAVEIARDRLSGDDQGLRRRRRQGPARCLQRRRSPRRLLVLRQRSPQLLRRRPRLHRKVRARAAPHRNPGARRLATATTCT